MVQDQEPSLFADAGSGRIIRARTAQGTNTRLALLRVGVCGVTKCVAARLNSSRAVKMSGWYAASQPSRAALTVVSQSVQIVGSNVAASLSVNPAMTIM